MTQNAPKQEDATVPVSQLRPVGTASVDGDAAKARINHNNAQNSNVSDSAAQDKSKSRADSVVHVTGPEPAQVVINTRTAISSAPASSSAATTTGSQLRADTAPFRPAALLLDSSKKTGDSRNVIGATSPDSKELVKIGSPSSASSGSFEPVMFEGPPWSFNEADGCTDSSRFIEFRGIYHAKLVYAKDETIKSITKGALTHGVIIVDVDQPLNTLQIYFDDIREAERCKRQFNVDVRANEARSIAAADYFARDPRHPKARAINEYEGQVSIVATFCGPKDDCKLEEMYTRIRYWLAQYGDLRSFSCVRSVNPVKAVFRAEFHRLSDSDKVLRVAGIDQTIDDDYHVTTGDYLPPGYARWTHPATVALTQPDHAPATPDTTYRISSTNRTAWVGEYALTPSEVSRISRGSPLSHGYSTPSRSQGSMVVRPSYGSPVPRRPMQYAQTSDYHRNPEHRGSDYTLRRTSTPGFSARGMFDDEPPFGSPFADRRRGANTGSTQSQAVDMFRIEDGQDVRTTLMIRNIPNRFTWIELKDIINRTSFGQYDFLYLRTDFQNACNVGYAFINFISPEHIVAFMKGQVGQPWPGVNSDKLCEISYATIQGQDCLINKFRNSSVMREYHGYRPKLFYSYESLDMPEGKAVGDECDFPEPDNLSKLARSLDNAQVIGLYPPRGSQLDREDRRRRSQFDRGTPRAELEEQMYTHDYNAGGYTPGRCLPAPTSYGMETPMAVTPQYNMPRYLPPIGEVPLGWSPGYSPHSSNNSPYAMNHSGGYRS